MYPDGSPANGPRPPRSDRQQLDLGRPDAYGRAFADVYDNWYGSDPRTTRADLAPGDDQPGNELDAMARFVADRTPSGLVIELGVGSGRLAAPLVDKGLTVIGLDASRAMLSRCRHHLLLVEADMADPPLGPVPDGSTILCGFNTLFNLGDDDRLGRLLESVARSGCRFIVEMFNVGRLAEPPATSTGRSSIGADVGLVVSTVSTDPERRIMVGRHLEITDDGAVSRPWRLRLVDLPELDDTARRHGLEPSERYGSWQQEPLSPTSESVVAVYRPSPGTGL